MLRGMQSRGNSASVVSKEGELATTLGICQIGSLSEKTTTSLREYCRVHDSAFYSEDQKKNPNPYLAETPDALYDSPGAFALIGLFGDVPVIARDPLGLKPLYWGEGDDGNYCFASLIGSLKRIGIEDPKPVGPGTVTECHDSGLVASTKYRLSKPEQVKIL